MSVNLLQVLRRTRAGENCEWECAEKNLHHFDIKAILSMPVVFNFIYFLFYCFVCLLYIYTGIYDLFVFFVCERKVFFCWQKENFLVVKR